ncbi:MAG: T9SS type A sorting domain-containing protein [Bacteroidota bacterium]
MKKINTLLAVLFCFVLGHLQAQEGRFMQEVFTDVTVTSDVTYGVNATVIALPILGEAIPQELKLDVYEPIGDERAERPLVLVFHTGNFLPVPQNAQILGRRTDSAAVEICTRLAKYGYTAASVTYRQGWNPLAETQPIRALGLIQAAYRGVQDGRTAVRFFKRDFVENGNQFSVDTSRIAIWGNGTGGYLTHGMVGLTNYNEILTTTNGPAKFILDTDEDGTPETPMVVPQVHGDIEGKTFGFGLEAFGFPLGMADTTSYPNHVEYNSDFQLAVNVGGDLGDISWLEAGNPPTITFQSANDFFAPYEDATLIVPTTGDPIVRVQGGLLIARKQNELGNNDVFINANIDDDITAQAKANSEAAGHEYLEGLYPVVNPPNANGLDEGVRIDWWDPNALSPPVEGFPNGVPWSLLPHPTDPSGMTSFHEQGLLTNAGMSAEQARTHIDTVFAYFAPRAFAALDLAAYTSTEELKQAEVGLVIAPNPATDEFILRSEASRPMLGVELYDLNGRLVQEHTFKNSYFFIQRDNLPDGIYVARVRFEEGMVSKKVMFK